MAQVSLREPSSAKKEKTFVSVFHELCQKFEFGVAKFVAEQGDPHSLTFLMNLTVDILGITGITFNCYKLSLRICNN
jgi:hypothetical protein